MRMSRGREWLIVIAVGLSVLGVTDLARPQDPPGRDTPVTAKRPRNRARAEQPKQDPDRSEVPAHAIDVILGRPTAHAVTLSVLTDRDDTGTVAYGRRGGPLDARTPRQQFAKGEPLSVRLDGLDPDTAYAYELRTEQSGSIGGDFHTQRPPGQPFTFTITADTHLDDRVNPALYQRSLANALADEPDFHIDLGDTFMTEKHASRDDAARQYRAQRYYFGQLSRSAPLFLALGNHDGESPRGRGGVAADDLAVWSNRTRKRYFPNPEPDDFFRGNAVKHPEAGLLQDYFAWEWGDALLVVLDPFWYSDRGRRGGSDDLWNRTLGEAQYRWLADTLATSRARFRFVFIHHLVGSATPEGRGGVEVAPYFEWGGKNLDGTDGFAAHRPGWPDPIHALLVKHHATAVFHGHDHLYVRQELDGVVYQEVPQPGTRGNNAERNAAEYGYRSGVIHGSPGHLRVRVEPEQVRIEYVRAAEARSAPAGTGNGQVVHSATIRP